jgi:hypothetical protein
MKQKETTPLCPDGCSCIPEPDAKLKGLTIKCDEKENPCGYPGVGTTADFAPTRISLYCYKTGITVTPSTQVCKVDVTACRKLLQRKNLAPIITLVARRIPAGTTPRQQPQTVFPGTVSGP